jgi:hypothetical protein
VSRKLQATRLTARDIRALTHDPQFQSIADRKSQVAFTKSYAAHECGLSLNGKEPVTIYKISVGHVKKLLHTARQQRDATRPSRRLPLSPVEDQERELVEFLLSTAESGQFPVKRELLAEVKRSYGRILTSGWVQTFLARHTEQIMTRIIHPQENPRLEAPQQFLGHILTLSAATLLERIQNYFTILMKPGARIGRSGGVAKGSYPWSLQMSLFTSVSRVGSSIRQSWYA